MKRLSFLAGFVSGLVAAYYGAWLILYRYLTRGAK